MSRDFFYYFFYDWWIIDRHIMDTRCKLYCVSFGVWGRSASHTRKNLWIKRSPWSENVNWWAPMRQTTLQPPCSGSFSIRPCEGQPPMASGSSRWSQQVVMMHATPQLSFYSPEKHHYIQMIYPGWSKIKTCFTYCAYERLTLSVVLFLDVLDQWCI